MPSLEAIRRLKIETVETGTDGVTAKLRGLASAQEGVTVASERATKSTLSVEAAYNRLQRQYDSAWRAQREIEKVQRTLTAAREQGLGSEARHGELLALAEAQTRRLGVANDNHVRSTNAQSYALKNLGFQLNDTITQLSLGQGLFRTMASQGGQLAQAVGESGGLASAFKSTASWIGSVVTVGRLAGGVLAAGAAVAYTAWSRVDDQQKRISVTLQGLGTYAGVTVSQFTALAERAAAAGKISTRNATEIADALARTGNLSAENIEKITALSRNVAATFGTDLSGAKDRMVSLFADPAKAMETLQRQFRFLNISEQEHIEKLIRTGREQEAVSLIVDRWKGRLADANTTTGAFSRLWEGIKNTISDADQRLGALLDKQARMPRPDQLARVDPASVPTPPGGRVWVGPNLPPTVASTTPQVLPKPEEIRAVATEEQKRGAFLLEQSRIELDLVAIERQRIELIKQGDRARDIVKEATGDIEAQRLAKEHLLEIEKALASPNLELRDRVLRLNGSAEALSRYRHEVKTTLTAEQRAAKQGEASTAQTLANTQAERTRAAVLSRLVDLAGQRISKEQAAIEVENARRAVLDQDKRVLDDMGREQEFVNEQLKLERELLFASDATRAAAMAGLQAEQDLRRRGIPIFTEEAQARIKAAEAAARGKVEINQTQKAVDDLSRMGISAFQGLANAIASGLKPMQALKSAATDLGRALVSAGIQTVAKSGGNPAAVGVGLAEVGVGAALQVFGASGQESAAAKRRKQMIQAEQDRQNQLALDAIHARQSADQRIARLSDETQLLKIGDTSTLEAALKALAVKQTREYWEELSAGGQALVALQARQNDERLALEKTFADQRLEAARDLDRSLNSLRGKDFLNDAADLIKTIADMQSQGLDTSKIDEMFGLAAQRIVDDAELTGDAFNELSAVFPTLTGRLHEFTEATDDAARKLEETKRQTESAVRNIADYLANLTAGPQSTLSPQDRLTAAQATYTSQLTLAQAGNVDALNRITQDFDNLLDAAKGFYGSATGYQSIRSTGIGQLSALPAVAESTDPVVRGLLDVVTAINSQTSTLQLAINSGSASATAAALLPSFQMLNTTADAGLTLDELKAAGLAVDANLIRVFNEIDTNDDRMISIDEVTKQAALVQNQISANTQQGLVELRATTQLNPQGVAQYLSPLFDTLNTTTDKGLDFTEFSAGLTKLDAGNIKALFNWFDLDQDGLVSKTELIRAASTDTAARSTSIITTTDQTRAAVVATDAMNSNMNTLLASIKALNDNSAANLAIIKDANTNNVAPNTANSIGQSSFSSANNNMLTALNKIVWNTALTAYNTSLSYASGARLAGNSNVQFAEGGLVRGPGTGTSDSIPAWLSNMEYVNRAATVSRLGVGFFDALDRGLTPAVPVPMPVGNDNGNWGAMVAELRRLNDRVESLERTVAAGANGTIRAIGEAGDGVEEAVETGMGKVADETRRAVQARRAA